MYIYADARSSMYEVKYSKEPGVDLGFFEGDDQ